MPRRVFVAINLDQAALSAIEKRVEGLKIRFPDRWVRFMPKENWHITISFLGNQDDTTVYKIAEILKHIVREIEPPKIAFEKFMYGPAPSHPRMIWLTTTKTTSETLETIKERLNGAFIQAGIYFRREHRGFNGHITLARLNFAEQNLSGLARLENVPQLPFFHESLSIAFETRSLDFMESHLGRLGAHYDILGEFSFGGG